MILFQTHRRSSTQIQKKNDFVQSILPGFPGRLLFFLIFGGIINGVCCCGGESNATKLPKEALVASSDVKELAELDITEAAGNIADDIEEEKTPNPKEKTDNRNQSIPTTVLSGAGCLSVCLN